ncbi:MAG: shikimate dehydrogenase family protein [Candidatus Coproplasma sp.]
MKKLAVIGKDVSKSASPVMHRFIAENMGNSVTYDAISIDPDGFKQRIADILKEYDGLNVTIPFKLEIIPELEKIEGDAAVFGAVNTVINSDRTGYNTDGLGFMLMLSNNGVEVSGKKVLLLGAGGAGRSVAKKLTDAGAKVYVYDRFTESAQNLAREFRGVTALSEVVPSDYEIEINATGVGMHKTEGISPVGEDVLKSAEVAVDLIYVPEKSEFLSVAERLGKKIINGSAMLFYQAYYAECIFFGEEPDAALAKRLFEKYKKEVLI